MQGVAVTTAPFFDDLAEIEGLAAAEASDTATLLRNLSDIYAIAANAEFSDYDVAGVRKSADAIIYRLFDVRIGLRHRIADFERLGLMTADVEYRLRDVFRILRYVSDMLGEIGAVAAGPIAGGSLLSRAFTGQGSSTLVNWAYYKKNGLEFRSGDVLLVRGRAHNSAAIARIGDIDSQFSHVGIIFIDLDGNHWLVESLIEEGAIIKPLHDALGEHIARAVIYRHRDHDLAARAALAIHDVVADSRTLLGRRIAYDFTMRPDSGRNLFCSKLVRNAFDLASGGRLKLPSHPTRIGMQNRDFLDRIGVATELTFAPADMDLESGFDLVAEWQDYAATASIRHQDFTMDKLFEWMDLYGYKFRETPLIFLASLLGRLAARLSDRAKDVLKAVAPKVPGNMPRKAIAAVAMLHKTAESIVRHLSDLERDCMVRFGRPMHGREIYDALEAVRLERGARIGYLVIDDNKHAVQHGLVTTDAARTSR